MDSAKQELEEYKQKATRILQVKWNFDLVIIKIVHLGILFTYGMYPSIAQFWDIYKA